MANNKEEANAINALLSTQTAAALIEEIEADISSAIASTSQSKPIQDSVTDAANVKDDPADTFRLKVEGNNDDGDSTDTMDMSDTEVMPDSVTPAVTSCAASSVQNVTTSSAPMIGTSDTVTASKSGGEADSSSRHPTPPAPTPGAIHKKPQRKSSPGTRTGSSRLRGRKTPLPVVPGLDWKEGARLEAQDFQDKWYTAKILEVDESDEMVLIHFDGWNSRYDEWLSMRSERLRSLARHSERKDVRTSSKQAKAAASKDYRVGQCVFAKWTDCRMYPGKIVNINSSGSCEVLFYDGFKKTVQAINVKTMPPEVKQQYAKAGLLPETGKKNKFPINAIAKEIQEKKKEIKDKKGELRSEEEASTEKKVIERRKNLKAKYGDYYKKKKPRRESKEEDATENEVIESGEKGATEETTNESASEKVAANESEAQGSKDGGATKEGEAKEGGNKEDGVAKKGGSFIQQEKNITEKKAAVHDKDKRPKLRPQFAALLRDAVVRCSPMNKKKVTEGNIPKKSGDAQKAGDSATATTSSDSNKATAGSENKDNADFTCTFSGCEKTFRKQSGLDSHVKYYHTNRDEKSSYRRYKRPADAKQEKIRAPKKRRQDPFAAHRAKAKETRDTPKATVSESDTQPQLVEWDELSNAETKTTTTEDYQGAADLDDTEGMDRIEKDEVVNCICQINEENGLMIQCDVCLCWQHALCMNLTNDTLPAKYMCVVCTNPPGVRESARFCHDQDWLTQGTMPSFSCAPNDDIVKARKFKATNTLLADVIDVNDALKSAELQIHAYKSKWTEEMDVWKRVADRQARITQPSKSLEEISKPSENMNELETKAAVSSQPTFPSSPHSVHSDSTISADEDYAAKSSKSPKRKPAKTVPDKGHSNKATDDVVEIIKIKEEPGSSETIELQITKNMPTPTKDQSLPETIKIEKPAEDAISGTTSDVSGSVNVAEEGMLRYIDTMHDGIEERLDFLEEQVMYLENEQKQGSTPHEQNLPKVKRSLRHLLNDLGKLQRLTLHNSTT